MLSSLVWILLMGFFGGQLFRRMGLPALVGMVLVGILLGPSVSGILQPSWLTAAAGLRTIAVLVILMRAGLGLDPEKLQQQGTVAVRLGFLPAIGEAIVVAVAATYFFGMDGLTGLLLGCVLAAESPAVIVPGMLKLKSLGWGVKKGIPDAILTGSALSDVLLLLVFSLLMSILTPDGGSQGLAWGPIVLTPAQRIFLQLISQIALGIGIGWGSARLLVVLLTQQNWAQNAVQEAVITTGLGLGLVVLAEHYPWFSGYLAVMASGFFLTLLDAPLARQLRTSFNALWGVAELFLFVLLGASIHLDYLEKVALPGLAVLAIGTLVGRSVGWYLSTLGSNWTWRERLFLLPGNSAKATVQAAIGAIPLAQGVAGGETILALAALSILVTAPLGAWGIPTFAPQLLTQDEVDPTKISVDHPIVLLAAVDTSALAIPVLKKTGELARRSNASVVVLHVLRADQAEKVERLREQSQILLADIRHRFMTHTGSVPETILAVAQDYQVDELIIGKRGHRSLREVLLGSTSQALLETSPIPVIVVEDSP
ncbi:MAG: cation:proton antiporter [Prochlorotrichaceae cyanobacterium]